MSALGAGQRAAATTTSSSTTTTSSAATTTSSPADDLPAVKAKNKDINIFDPPKDLYAEGNLKDGVHGDFVGPLIKSLFSPNDELPEKFKAIGDTKDALKEALGKPFMDGLQKDTARLKILREKSTAGHDGKPSGLYVSQDSGPSPYKLINNPNLIVTPGTILDSAAKTKKGAVSLVQEYGSLPLEYINEVSMENVIIGPITMNEANNVYTVTIPTSIGVSGKRAGAAGDVITGTLSTKTYKAEAKTDDNEYFKGNDTKNAYIETNYKTKDETIKNNMMKYILVKELGDTLQVMWLKSIINNSDKYTVGNSVITTGDTVVWYRCVLNKVPVMVTYMGETFLYKAGDSEVMIASFVKTIREDTIKNNLSVINTLKAVAKEPRVGDKWIGELTWTVDQHAAALGYLTKIIPKLENFNKDADIYFDNIVSIDAAQKAAARHHFENPFTLNKKNNVWKTNNMVTQIFPGVPFYAASFKPLSIISSLKMLDQFRQVGGGQKGGARATIKEKIDEAETLSPEEYFAKRLAEWDFPGVVAHEIPKGISKGVSDPTKHIIGDFTTFMNENKNESWNFWTANAITLAERKTLTSLNEKPFFLYVFVKENFPQIFTYASMMGKALNGRYSEGLLHYEKKFSIEYVEDDGIDGGMLGEMKIISKTNEMTSAKTKTNYMEIVKEQIEKEAKKHQGAITRDIRKGFEMKAYTTVYDKIKKEKDVEEAFTTTWNAIKLAIQLTDDYPVLLTQELADFFDYLKYVLPSETGVSGAGAGAGAGAGSSSTVTSSKGQHGGGPKSLNPVTSKAIDYYELYYTLLVKASYENRNVTDEDFMDEILSREEEIQTRVREVKESQRKMTSQTPLTMRTGTPSAPFKYSERPFETAGMNIPRLVFGGKRRYKKTQKKRKSKQRKTRKHRN